MEPVENEWEYIHRLHAKPVPPYFLYMFVYFLSLTPVIDILVKEFENVHTLNSQTDIYRSETTDKYHKLNPIDGENFICDEGRLLKLPP